MLYYVHIKLKDSDEVIEREFGTEKERTDFIEKVKEDRKKCLKKETSSK